ncbi:MAG: hypothetical protein PVG14_12905 [Anaerolineales bacterium]
MMDKVLRRILIVTSAMVAGAILLWIGILIGRNAWGTRSYIPNNMMSDFASNQSGRAYLPSGNHMGSGMMGYDMHSQWDEAGMSLGMMGGYGHTNHSGLGGMMGFAPIDEINTEMPISLKQAVEAAQSYLDQHIPGTEADDHTDPFYGYYTLHILKDGEVVGMLSVNGYNSQVFPHIWHGDFIEMREDH